MIGVIAKIFFPILIFKVVGQSMSFTISEGKKVVVCRYIPIHQGDIVVCRDPEYALAILKRVTKIKNGKVFVEGDNKKEGRDSNDFGWLTKKDIIGKVLYVF